ncbi:MAG: FG-GAP-like repeat-containing protein [Candidatus Latescibacterota bacterium]|jgi:hypothetical protein
MLRLAVVVLLFVVAPAQAITWSFDQEGDSQGWRARESVGAAAGSRTMLRTEARDGIWRVTPAPFEAGSRPSLELVSPPIHRDSALFDRLTVRLRVVHTQPLTGVFAVTWTNEHNQSTPGGTGPDPLAGGQARQPLYSLGRAETFTTQWQELTISEITPGVVTLSAREYEVIWDGELIDLRVNVDLGGTYASHPFAGGPEEVPEALEIDWIRLTGVEEQLQGELPPPVLTETTPFGDLFAPAVFCPLSTRGVGGLLTLDSTPGGALGDLDGDGDLDLVAVWEVLQTMPDQPPGRKGWLAALNDGTGLFGRDHPEQLFSGSPSPLLTVQGADLDGNGRMDLVIDAGNEWARVYANDQQDGLVVSQEFRDTTPLLRDAEGDGDFDLYLIEYTLTQDRMESTDADLWLMRNEGGVLAPRVSITLEGSRPDFMPTSYLPSNLADGATGVLWQSWGTQGQGYEITCLDAGGEVVQQHLATNVDLRLARYIGDFDLDGDVDLIVSDSNLFDMNAGLQFKGLSLLLNQGDGTLERSAWFPHVLLRSDVRWADLNGDGRLDPVFVENDFRSPAVVVCLGMPAGLPVQEGRYPLSGTGGMVLAGDVDSDGDVDLVVLERNIQGQGGVHVLLSRLAEQRTAVLESEGQVPLAFHLGLNYPNPFNPQTWIPVEIPASAEAARLQVYNLLGQPIRTLVSGRMTPGYHAVPWDGRDELGAAVSSGAYLYRLEAGPWRATGRMVKNQ